MGMIVPLFEQPDTLTKGKRVDEQGIDKVFVEWVGHAEIQTRATH